MLPLVILSRAYSTFLSTFGDDYMYRLQRPLPLGELYQSSGGSGGAVPERGLVSLLKMAMWQVRLSLAAASSCMLSFVPRGAAAAVHSGCRAACGSTPEQKEAVLLLEDSVPTQGLFYPAMLVQLCKLQDSRNRAKLPPERASKQGPWDLDLQVLWAEPQPAQGWPPAAAGLRRKLKEAAGTLLGQLHDRNCRRAFAPAEAFQTEHLPPARFHAEVKAAAASVGGLMEARHTRVWALLTCASSFARHVPSPMTQACRAPAACCGSQL